VRNDRLITNRVKQDRIVPLRRLETWNLSKYCYLSCWDWKT